MSSWLFGWKALDVELQQEEAAWQVAGLSQQNQVESTQLHHGEPKYALSLVRSVGYIHTVSSCCAKSDDR